MQKIAVLFLGDADRATFNYEGIENKVAKDYGEDNFLASLDSTRIREFLDGFSTDQAPLLITLLAHGGIDCISAKISDDDWIRLPYTDLLAYIAGCRTLQPVQLNLIAPCNTVNALPLLPNYNIDEVWYTTRLSDSLYNGLTAADHGFKRFSFMDQENRFFRYSR